MKKIVYFLPFLILFAFFSCDDEPLDNDILTNVQNNNAEGSLYDKWWYDSGDFTADIYFHSSGLYEQRIVLLGIEFTASGDWFWLDESNGIMKLENLTGDSQLVTETWFKFSEITNNSFTLQQSTDGNSYSVEVYYLDTDN